MFFISLFAVSLIKNCKQTTQAQPEDMAESPFLIINEKEVTLFGLPSLHKEASSLNVPSQSIDFEFPLERWVHFGCEVMYELLNIDEFT